MSSIDVTKRNNAEVSATTHIIVKSTLKKALKKAGLKRGMKLMAFTEMLLVHGLNDYKNLEYKPFPDEPETMETESPSF